MAQEKLLFLVIMLAVVFAGFSAEIYGEDKLANKLVDKEEEKWASALSEQAIELHLQQLSNLLEDKTISKEAAYRLRRLINNNASSTNSSNDRNSSNSNNDSNSPNSTNSGVMVFVSSSMPTGLLQQYAREAEKLGAALIFKGLPSSSFRELAKLVMTVQGERGECAMQIDDEAFARYGVTIAPTIVRVREQNCVIGRSCATEFDKVVGSISIKAALEIMSQDREGKAKRQQLFKEQQ